MIIKYVIGISLVPLLTTLSLTLNFENNSLERLTSIDPFAEDIECAIASIEKNLHDKQWETTYEALNVTYKSSHVYTFNNVNKKFALTAGKAADTGWWTISIENYYGQVRYYVTLQYENKSRDSEKYVVECPMSPEEMQLNLEKNYGESNSILTLQHVTRKKTSGR